MKKKINNDHIDLERNDDVISARETTGLTPSLPRTDYEMDSYKEIDEFMEKPICKRKKYNNHPQTS